MNKGKIILPFYHSICDQELKHIKHLYPIKSVREFEKDLDFLLKHYHPVLLTEKLSLDSNLKDQFLLSFDDGLKECYEIILPILLKKNLKAIFFINTGFLDNKALFYRFKISLIWEKILTDGLNPQQFGEITKQFNLENYREIENYLFSINWSNQHLLEPLASIINLDFEDYLKNSKPYLSSTQLEEMQELGFIIGGHSHTHPLYAKIDEQTRMNETEKCMEELEGYRNEFSVFSFPFSDHGIGTDQLLQMKEQAKLNYLFGSAGIRDEINLFHLQRIPMEKRTVEARSILCFQLLKYKFLSILGKNIVRRSQWN
ncbi:MAG: polysaccharide deacetylase family protein [Saprospiraceae bacterium]|nr:polysaccharide deacetylase family protein [Saprospiraceae bacterium]MBK7810256.1 polysaccharide deacetylase family protein [Saprospiraceae bacterium]MBK9629859.1 polysaccharide deacetylase family protein [Saprospiraceae bacterium]